jgi:hypothetical protein
MHLSFVLLAAYVQLHLNLFKVITDCMPKPTPKSQFDFSGGGPSRSRLPITTLLNTPTQVRVSNKFSFELILGDLTHDPE